MERQCNLVLAATFCRKYIVVPQNSTLRLHWLGLVIVRLEMLKLEMFAFVMSDLEMMNLTTIRMELEILKFGN